MLKDNKALLIVLFIILFAFFIPLVFGAKTISLVMLANQLCIILIYSLINRNIK